MVDFTFMFPFLLMSTCNPSYYHFCILLTLLIIAIIIAKTNDFRNASPP
jgi:hypothetical protein